jgi:hypothetical protein
MLRDRLLHPLLSNRVLRLRLVLKRGVEVVPDRVHLAQEVARVGGNRDDRVPPIATYPITFVS